MRYQEPKIKLDSGNELDYFGLEDAWDFYVDNNKVINLTSYPIRIEIDNAK
jgi:hypothetical protein